MLSVTVHEPRAARRQPALTPGKLVKITKTQKAGYYGQPPPLNRILLLTDTRGVGDGGTFYTLQDFLGNQTYTSLASGTEAALPTKAEVAEFRDAMQNNILRGKVKAYVPLAHCVGSDPEVFVLDENGMVMPAFQFLPHRAHPIASQDRSCVKAFWDGFQAEFTIPPYSCVATIVDYIHDGLKLTLGQARKLNPQAHLTAQCVADTPPELLSISPPEGVLLGCAPSLNAYSQEVNPALQEINPSELPFRFAGFHVHLGIGKQGGTLNRQVKVIDKIAGVASVCAFRGLEDVRRRKYYGLAGEYRLPAHGLEYRVLSSAVLAHPVATHLAFDLVRMAYSFAAHGLGYLWSCSDEEAQTAINNLDVDLASDILKRNAAIFERLLHDGYNGHISNQVYGEDLRDGRAQAKAQRLINEGVKNLLNTTDLAANWKLNGEWGRHSDNDRATVANWNFT